MIDATATLDLSVHAVRFYTDSESLCRSVAMFVGDGLVAGDGGVIVATRPHRHGIALQLRQRGLDIDELERDGNVVFVDADDLLDRIVVDGAPSWTQLHAAIAPILQQTSRGHQRRVRVYGEMVDVLCRQQRVTDAIQLEMLWNELAKMISFSLLCGYATGNNYEGGAVDDICGQHSHVLSASGVPTSL